MKLYEYISSTNGEILRVKELEAEEKEKTYKLKRGTAWRTVVKKDEIGVLLDGYCLNMYLVERDDERYIKTLIEYQEAIVNRYREKITYEESKLEKYKSRIKCEEATK